MRNATQLDDYEKDHVPMYIFQFCFTCMNSISSNLESKTNHEWGMLKVCYAHNKFKKKTLFSSVLTTSR